MPSTIIALLSAGPLAILGICYLAWRSGMHQAEQRQQTAIGTPIRKSKS